MANTAMTTVNGEEYFPEVGETIADLLTKRTGIELRPDGKATDGQKLGLAVAVNEEVLTRGEWATTPVAGEIEIVTAVQGG